MRIVWRDPPPSDDPGVPTVATRLIEGLACAGAEVDVHAATGQTRVSARTQAVSRFDHLAIGRQLAQLLDQIARAAR
jgi:hypothetical protein